MKPGKQRKKTEQNKRPRDKRKKRCKWAGEMAKQKTGARFWGGGSEGDEKKPHAKKSEGGKHKGEATRKRLVLFSKTKKANWYGTEKEKTC